MHDVIIVNGRLVDGTGAPATEADLALQDGRIAAIGSALGAARQTVDAAGLIVAPGFIDPHNHADSMGHGGIAEVPAAPNFLPQGVTTVIGGNCGLSPVDLADHFARVQAGEPAINYGCLIAHGSVRQRVMGNAMEAPGAQRLDEMRDWVAAALEAGAVGLSSGLWYAPGVYAETGELVELARIAADYGRLYTSHIRNERIGTGETAIAEAIEIGRRAGVPVEISHFKCAEQPAWGRATSRLRMLEEARAGGLDVNADAYPYTASSTGLGVLLPAEAHEGEGAPAKLGDPALRAAYREHVRGEIADGGGADRILLTRVQPRTELGGKRLDEVAQQMGLAPENAVLEILEHGTASAIYFMMDQADVDTIVEHPLILIGSDGSLQIPGDGSCHPRSWGTFARVLGRYARERATLSWEQAVHKMTGMTAAKFGLKGRGVLAEGNWADVVVFDPATIADRATYDDPHQPPAGIAHVFVNGRLALSGGHPTGARAGQVLRQPVPAEARRRPLAGRTPTTRVEPPERLPFDNL